MAYEEYSAQAADKTLYKADQQLVQRSYFFWIGSSYLLFLSLLYSF